MGHQPEDAARLVADAGHIPHRAVGIRRGARRIGGIPQHQLARDVERLEVLGRPRHEPALAVGDREFEPIHALQEHATTRHRPQMNPAIDEHAGRVVGEACPGSARSRIGEQEARLQEHLKAVADAEDEAAAIAKCREAVGEPRPQFQRKDPSAGDVVAVGEAAGDAEDLKVVGERRLPRQGMNVHAAGDRAGPLEGMCRFVVAVGARCPQDQRPW